MDASGLGIPGVTVWAGFPRNTTTDADGNYTFTGLPAGTYNIRPEKDPYAFSPGSVPITVPENATRVDFQAIAITKIQVNQALGNTTNYVAGKDTAVRVFMSDVVPYEPAYQQLVVYRDGNLITSTPLKPLRFDGRAQVLDFLCDRAECAGWQKGIYSFEARINGNQPIQSSAEFKERGGLRIRVVPIETKAGSPVYAWAQIHQFIAQVYPVEHHGILWAQMGGLDATDLDLTTSAGKQVLETRLQTLEPPGCDLASGSNCYRILGIIHYDPDVGKGWTRTARVAVVADVPEIQTVIAHEIGHDIGYTTTNPHHSGLGDVYSGGTFQCEINPAPKSYVGTDGRDGPNGKSCDSGDEFAWDPSPAAPDASGSVVHGTGDNQDYPYEVGGRGALGDKLSFMGHGESQENFWVTPDVYAHLFNQLTEPLTQAAVAIPVVGRVVVVSGWIGRDRSVTLSPAYHMMAPSPAGTAGAYSIEVLDSQRQLLASQGFDVSFVSLSDPPQDTDDAPFRVSVNFPEEAQAVRVTQGAVVLTEMTVSAHVPTLSLTYPNGGEVWTADGDYVIRWQAADLDGDPLHYVVLYRQGIGDWNVLAGNLTTSELAVDARDLPGGNAVRVKVLATDGLNTAEAESATFRVGRKSPEAVITYPADGAVLRPGLSFFLQGTAYDLEDGALPDSAYQWSSDEDGDLGGGASNMVTLTSGEHVITLMVTDSDGNTVVKTIRLSAGYQQFLPLVFRN